MKPHTVYMDRIIIHDFVMSAWPGTLQDICLCTRVCVCVCVVMYVHKFLSM